MDNQKSLLQGGGDTKVTRAPYWPYMSGGYKSRQDDSNSKYKAVRKENYNSSSTTRNYQSNVLKRPIRKFLQKKIFTFY